MTKLALWAVTGLLLAGCSQPTEKGDFKINAHIDNAPLGTIYLEELTTEEVKVVDTAVIKDASGKFTLKGMLPEQGLYRIRFAGGNTYIPLGLDAGTMSITGDYNHLDQLKIDNSEATTEIQELLKNASEKDQALSAEFATLDSLRNIKTADSILQPKMEAFQAKQQDFKQFFIKSATDTKYPAVAAFIMSILGPQVLSEDPKLLDEIRKHFPENTLIANFTDKLKQGAQQVEQQSPAEGEESNMTTVKVGQTAPDFTLPDITGKAVSLRSFKGKYVLVDFWASWCKPCRMENPNVVQAFNKFKGKNFTIVGVSLDKSKDAWAKAIEADGLTWTHVSDLKFWDSEVVPLYGISSIPSNMLLDPQGKVLAVGLRGPALEAKLQEILK
jgi:peroxiredoxin